MKIKLIRIYRGSEYTIGKLYVTNNGKDVWIADTLEDCDRLYFGKPKVMNKTAIPCGTYEVLLNNYSPKYGNREPYKSLCNGFVPLINNVPNFSGVRIHIGNDANDTSGCVLVGKNKVVGKVVESRATFTQLMNRFLTPARKRGEKVFITIE